MATEYGSRLKQARKHAGLTQVELSKKTGIPQSTISTAEREGHGSGETPVYAQACGVNALWLANGSGSMIDVFSTSNQPLATASIAQEAINGIATISQTLEQLNSLLSGVDSGTRETIANLTQESICKPDKAQANIAAIEALVRFATGKIETAAIVPATHP